jgi:hypothetical protein
MRLIFFAESETNVRVKACEVNPVFLVQLRKMVATDFYGFAPRKDLVRCVALSREGGAGSGWESAGGRKFRRAVRRIVHRGCTGNAERQWSGSVASGQFPVGGGAGSASLRSAGQPRRLSPHEFCRAADQNQYQSQRQVKTKSKVNGSRTGVSDPHGQLSAPSPALAPTCRS